MAKSTFLELVGIVCQECGVSGNAPVTVTGATGEIKRVVDWVANADQETKARWFNWDFLHVDDWTETTVIGTAAVSAPADIGVWDVESFMLDYNTNDYSSLLTMDYKVWRARFRNGVKVNGKPTHVVIKPDQSLILESPPDAAYLLSADYWMRPVKMTQDSDTSEIPEEYERVIVARAKMFYAEYEGANEVMQSSAIEYDDLLDKLEAKYLPGQHPARRMTDTTQMVVRTV